jgi:hypothetical protein
LSASAVSEFIPYSVNSFWHREVHSGENGGEKDSRASIVPEGPLGDQFSPLQCLHVTQYTTFVLLLSLSISHGEISV